MIEYERNQLSGRKEPSTADRDRGLLSLLLRLGRRCEEREDDVKHWSRCSPYAVARALYEQYNVDWDQAFRMAWYAMRRGVPNASLAQVLYRMQQVQNVPLIPESVMRMFQLHLREVLMGREIEGKFYGKRDNISRERKSV